MLKQKIQEDLKIAMKAGDSAKRKKEKQDYQMKKFKK